MKIKTITQMNVSVFLNNLDLDKTMVLVEKGVNQPKMAIQSFLPKFPYAAKADTATRDRFNC
jgi:hypothetical protein